MEDALETRASNATPVAARLLWTGAALAGLAFVFQTVGHLANELVFDKRFWHLDSDVDGNAMTWLSALATLLAGMLAFRLALVSRRRRRQLLAVGAILVFFAIDDALAFHEDLGMLLARVGLPEIAGIWFPIYVPLLAFTAGVLWTLEWPWRPAVAMLRLGVLLLGAAIVGEVIAAGAFPAIDRADESLGYELEVALEEAAELAGWLLISSALAGAGLLRLAHTDETEEVAATTESTQAASA